MGHVISSSNLHAHSFPIQTRSQAPQEAEFLCWEGVPHPLGMPATSSECLLCAGGGGRRQAGAQQYQSPSRRSEMGEVIWTQRPSDRSLRNDISNSERLTGRSQAAQQAENTGSSTGDSGPWPGMAEGRRIALSHPSARCPGPCWAFLNVHAPGLRPTWIPGRGSQHRPLGTWLFPPVTELASDPASPCT